MKIIKWMSLFMVTIFFCIPLLFMMMIASASGGGFGDASPPEGMPPGGGEVIGGSEISVYGFVLPTPEFVVNSPFGKRPGILNGFHNGTDLDCNTGDPILALADGKIQWTGLDKYGAQIITMNFPNNGNAYAMYAHMSKTYVRANQEVRRGEVIAACGSTGYSTGPHLHIEIKIGGTYRNPENYLPKKGYQTDTDENENKHTEK